MAGPNIPRSGDLFSSGFGRLGPDIQGGSVDFDPSEMDHHSVYGNDGRFSWNGDGKDIHFTDQGYAKGDPGRHPFGR